MPNPALDLYKKYFQDRRYERLGLFQSIAEKFDVRRALYPGSFVHVTPSFIFPVVVYVDNDKQAKQFFSEPEIYQFIAQNKAYPQAAQVKFHFADYRNGFDETEGSFDLLISQYAGWVGQECKQYLKAGGFLLANDSHGDAGIAALDDDYQLKAVFLAGDEKYQISETNLDAYFAPKSSQPVTKEGLEKLGKGIGYKKTASVYLFQKIG